MKTQIDKKRFGPWALVTGASSGIGKEFARQIAASGINVVLVARRDALLAELGRAISQEFDVQYRALAMDLSQEGFIAGLSFRSCMRIGERVSPVESESECVYSKPLSR
jgi:short-subunit dehydrogenase